MVIDEPHRVYELLAFTFACLALLGVGGVWKLRKVVAVTTSRLVEEKRRRRVAESRAHWIQNHDVHTELPHADHFAERVGSLLSQTDVSNSKQIVALKLADVDKTIRTLGHQAALTLVRDFAKRLRSMEFEAYGKSGRDIFFVFGDKQQIILKLRQAGSLTDTLRFQTNSTTRTFAGASTWPQHGTEVPDLLRRSETALAIAIQKREEWTEYRRSMEPDEADLKLLSLYRKTGGAGIYPVFQPQIDIRSGKVFGAEALARWDAAGVGLVLPCRFIPLLEEAGLIRHVTRRLIRGAVRVAARMRNDGFPCPISVNVAAGDLLGTRLRTDIQQALSAHGGLPGDLKLELTETSVTEYPEKMQRAIRALRNEGILVALDDFGTGYSSLSYLSDFAVHELKIDRSFVNGMRDRHQDRSIVRSTIAMGQELGLIVIAEGVENKRELEMLRNYGCDCAQGFLVSQPLSESEFIDFIQTASLARA